MRIKVRYGFENTSKTIVNEPTLSSGTISGCIGSLLTISGRKPKTLMH